MVCHPNCLEDLILALAWSLPCGGQLGQVKGGGHMCEMDRGTVVTSRCSVLVWNGGKGSSPVEGGIREPKVGHFAGAALPASSLARPAPPWRLQPSALMLLGASKCGNFSDLAESSETPSSLRGVHLLPQFYQSLNTHDRCEYKLNRIIVYTYDIVTFTKKCIFSLCPHFGPRTPKALGFPKLIRAIKLS